MLTLITDILQGKTVGRIRRSPKWAAFKSEFIKANPRCAVCGGTKNINPHHIIPFHVAPELELDVTNVWPLCESKKYGINCHQFFGHLGNFRWINKRAVLDSLEWKGKIYEARR